MLSSKTTVTSSLDQLLPSFWLNSVSFFESSCSKIYSNIVRILLVVSDLHSFLYLVWWVLLSISNFVRILLRVGKPTNSPIKNICNNFLNEVIWAVSMDLLSKEVIPSKLVWYCPLKYFLTILLNSWLLFFYHCSRIVREMIVLQIQITTFCNNSMA